MRLNKNSNYLIIKAVNGNVFLFNSFDSYVYVFSGLFGFKANFFLQQNHSCIKINRLNFSMEANSGYLYFQADGGRNAKLNRCTGKHKLIEGDFTFECL